MNSDYIPGGDREFLAWIQNFLTVANEFQQELGFTDEQMQDMADMVAAFNNDLGLSDAAKLQSVAATRQKNTTRDRSEEMFRERSDDAKSVRNLPETVLIGLGLNVPDDERTRRQPVKPENLVAELEAYGVVHLEWDSGGNTQGVQYVIEMQKGDSGEFILVDVVSRRRFTHENAPTGTRLTYRVRARRNGETSQPSNEASVRT